MTTLAPISTLLEARIGLKLAALSESALEFAVRQRMQLRQCPSHAEYLHLLRSDTSEFDRLVELMIVPETWFFRERAAFDFLRAHLTAQIGAQPQTTPWRILSAPCASGEEPYSICITLLEAGFPPHSFIVDAVDISQAQLEAARRLTYRARSLRDMDPACRAKYFQAAPDNQFQLQPSVASPVRFIRENIADPSFRHGQAPYHAIFCRNFLIYLTDRARSQVLDNCQRLLRPGALLFVGHAEATPEISKRFTSTQRPETFSFYNPDRISAPTSPLQPRSRPGDEPQPPSPPCCDREQSRSADPSGSRHRVEADRPRTTRPPATTPLPAAFHEIESLADAGRITEASSLCLDFLKMNPASAEGFHLLGILHLASGQPAPAEKAFEKAVYLNPSHRSSILHLLHIADAKGDRLSSQHWRRRLDRLQTTAAAS